LETNIFDYSPLLEASLTLARTTRHYQRYTISFPSAHPTRFAENNTVRGEYYQPSQGQNFPLVILVHGMGDRSAEVCKAFARDLVRRGLACFVLYLIVHSKRKPPRGTKGLGDKDWFENYRISVIDVRQVIDWAETRDEIDHDRIGVAGMSFGGFITAMALGSDPRLRSGVIIISGGNLEKIAFCSRTLPKKWGRRHTEEGFRAQQRRYFDYLATVDEQGLANVTPPDENYLVDALTYAHLLRDRPLLLIAARWDEVIPRAATLDFWERAGKPPISWLPGGHATVFLLYPLIMRKLARFFKATLSRKS